MSPVILKKKKLPQATYGEIKAKGLREEVCHNSFRIKCSFLSIMEQPTSDHSDLEQQQQQQQQGL